MLATAEIADRLSDGAAAVLSRAPGPLADIEDWLLLDHDPVLSALGRDMTIPQFAQPTALQRVQLIALLPQVWPETWRTSHVAFAAGLRGEA